MQPVPVFDHPQGRSVFLCLIGISCISVCVYWLVLLLSTTEQSLASSSLDPHIRHLNKSVTSSLSLLSKRNSPSFLKSLLLWEMLQSPDHLCCLLLESILYVHAFLYWKPQHWTQHSRSLSAGLSRGEGSRPSTSWQLSSLCHPGSCWVFFAVRMHYWLTFNLVCSRTPTSSCPKLFYSRQAPSMYGHI